MAAVLRWCLFVGLVLPAAGFVCSVPTRRPVGRRWLSAIEEDAAPRLSPLPPGVLYGTRKSANVQSQFQSVAAGAVARARSAGLELIEIQFPVLLGSKTQFDDFSNIEELDANRDWAMQFGQLGLADELGSSLWMIFADGKEAELATEEWPGKAFGRATITTLESAVERLGGSPEQPLFSPGMARAVLGGLFGGGARSAAAGSKSQAEEPPSVQLVVQPGEGGPMEDWMNVEKLRVPGTPLIVLNGALDKLRNGFYPKPLFPKLAECTERFYRPFEQVFYLKPISDGGFSGWLYRVYPEPWQIVAQTNDFTEPIHSQPERPSYSDAISILKRWARADPRFQQA